MPGIPSKPHDVEALAEAVAVARAAAVQMAENLIVRKWTGGKARPPRKRAIDVPKYKVVRGDAVEGQHWRDCYRVSPNGSVHPFLNNPVWQE